MNPTKTTVPIPDQIDHIMDNFDFDKVAQTMKLMNWTWYSDSPPTIPEMRKCARGLLKRLNKENVQCSTGGFRASKDQWGILDLAFVVTDWDAGEFCASKDRNINY